MSNTHIIKTCWVFYELIQAFRDGPIARPLIVGFKEFKVKDRKPVTFDKGDILIMLPPDAADFYGSKVLDVLEGSTEKLMLLTDSGYWDVPHEKIAEIEKRLREPDNFVVISKIFTLRYSP